MTMRLTSTLLPSLPTRLASHATLQGLAAGGCGGASCRQSLPSVAASGRVIGPARAGLPRVQWSPGHGDRSMAKVARSFDVWQTCLARWLRIAERQKGRTQGPVLQVRDLDVLGHHVGDSRLI